MPESGPDTILLDLFRTNQVRERLITSALEGLELPPEDYPMYVMIGAEGPWTPTAFAARVEMPLSTVLFRIGRLESRGHAERIPNPDDRRSYLVHLTDEGHRLLRQARPRFRAYAEAVVTRLGDERIGQLRDGLTDLREAIEQELNRE
jgi:DNA-binding MarR family transcriptional regulator